MTHMCSLQSAPGRTGLEDYRGRLRSPCCLNRVGHDRKIRGRKQRTDIGKYSFVNRTIQLWNQLPAGASGTVSCKPSDFRDRIRKVISEVKRRCGGNKKKCSEVKWSEVKWSEGRLIVVGMWRLHKCSEAEWREGHGEMQCTSSCSYVMHTVTVLLYSVLNFLLMLIHQL
jgi:hypothetical protein